jgi:hypothetical protein
VEKNARVNYTVETNDQNVEDRDHSRNFAKRIDGANTGKYERINYTESGKLIIVEGYINDVFLKNIVFDIGATTSIMAARVADQHGLKLRQSDVRIRVADNREIKVVGETNRLMLEVKGHKTRMAFTVIDGCEY